METVFEHMMQIEGTLAAAFINFDNSLAGWAANTAINPEQLQQLAQTCAHICQSMAGDGQEIITGHVAFGERTLVLRQFPEGMLILYLDSPVNDEVLLWLWEQVMPLLSEAGIVAEAA
ncbi:hypothetical protein DB346_19295 [Verrucomicrobia bacterium LW23]|nr:hypothetical protein DB346_19295 [Verrucomicrobia bacterium LW23]